MNAMKKRMDNQQVNSQKGFFLKMNEAVPIIKGLCIIFFLVLGSITTKGQQIQELNNKLAGMKASADPSVRAEGVHLENLVFDLQSTLYFEHGQLASVPVENAVMLNTDVSSFDMVLKSSYNKVEILFIKIESPQDLQLHLNLSSLKGYQNLKYIYFLCTFDLCPGQNPEGTCVMEKIAKMVNVGRNPIINVTYSVSIPS